jgi:transcription elongation factor GreA
MEGRIRQLEHMLEDAEIADDQFVYTVLYDGDAPDQAERYVVGHLEEQVEDAVLVSPSSPLGTALQSASAGQELTYQAPNGPLTITVLKVETV